MWWIIGIVTAAVLFLLVKRARTNAAHRALVVAGQNQFRVTLMPFCKSVAPVDWDDRVWRDEYLLGYLHGSVTLIVKLVGGELSKSQKGSILVDVLRGIIPGQWQEVCARVIGLNRSQHPEFMRGGSDGMNVVALSMNRLRPELMTEPDIQAALADAPRFDQLAEQIFGSDHMSAGQYGGAGAFLMSTHIQRHREMAGY